MSIKRKAAELAAADAKKTKPNASITSFFGAPKSVSTAVAIPPGSGEGESSSAPVTYTPPKFDKAKWAEKLTEEQRELLKLELDTLHDSWFLHLKEEMLSKEFLDLKRFLKKEQESGKTIFPPMQDVYSWSELTLQSPHGSVLLTLRSKVPPHSPQHR